MLGGIECPISLFKEHVFTFTCLIISNTDTHSQLELTVLQADFSLFNRMTKDEILDLIAYVISSGDPKHEYFQE